MKKEWIAPEITYLDVKNTEGCLDGKDNDGYWVSDGTLLLKPLHSGGSVIIVGG